MRALWAEVQRLRARLAACAAKRQEPVKEAHHAPVPPAHRRQANLPPGPRTGTRREASVGRAGGGRSRHPDPDQVLIAKAKTCPHGGGAVPAPEPHPHAVDDTIEWPPVKPIVTRVAPHGGQGPHGGQRDVAPVPVGREPGTPVGASSQGLATSRRDTHAISDERLTTLLSQVYGLHIREGALANRFQGVNTRLDHRVEEILTRVRRRRLRCSDETSARVHG